MRLEDGPFLILPTPKMNECYCKKKTTSKRNLAFRPLVSGGYVNFRGRTVRTTSIYCWYMDPLQNTFCFLFPAMFAFISPPPIAWILFSLGRNLFKGPSFYTWRNLLEMHALNWGVFFPPPRMRIPRITTRMTWGFQTFMSHDCIGRGPGHTQHPNIWKSHRKKHKLDETCIIFPGKFKWFT